MRLLKGGRNSLCLLWKDLLDTLKSGEKSLGLAVYTESHYLCKTWEIYLHVLQLEKIAAEMDVTTENTQYIVSQNFNQLNNDNIYVPIRDSRNLPKFFFGIVEFKLA